MRRTTLLAILVFTTAVAAQSAAPFNDSIRMADLKADLFFLAGDGFKGRLVGTPENALAANRFTDVVSVTSTPSSVTPGNRHSVSAAFERSRNDCPVPRTHVLGERRRDLAHRNAHTVGPTTSCRTETCWPTLRVPIPG